MLSLFHILHVLYYGDESGAHLTPEQERELAGRLQQGDRQAFDHIFSAFREGVFRFACRYLGDQVAAEDVLQETFIRLLANRAQIKRERGVKNLLFTIARNLCLDEMRKAGRRKTGSLDQMQESGRKFMDGRDNPEQNVTLQEMEQALEEFVDALPEREREALLLKKLSGLRYDEVADILGYSHRHAKTLVKQAVLKIVKACDQAGYTREGEFVV